MKWKLRNEKGQNLVEMALVMMLLLMLLAGAVDIGRAFHDYIVVTNSAREGVRRASRLPCTGANQVPYATAVASAAIAEANNSGVTISGGDVSYSPSCPQYPSTIVVTVTHSFTPIMTSFVSTNTFTLRNNAQMSAQYVPAP